MAQVTLFRAFLLFAFGLSVYTVFKLLYRIIFHPLAKFPGPKLAAVTSLWAASYDCSPRSSVVKLLPSLHYKHGPIVRVRPDELHIENWDAYFTVFKAGTRFNRDLSFYSNPQVDGSILNVADGEVAKPHKNLYLSAFSKAAVNRLEPLIHEKLGLFLERLATAAFKSSVVHLNAAYCCLTADVVMYYCYQRTFGFLDAPNFEVQMIQDLEDFAPMVPSFWYFPRFSAVMFNFVNFLSESARRKYFPAAAALNAIVEQCRERLTSLSTLPPDSKDLQNSIFKSALHPDRSKGQYIASSSELVGDAVLMFLAGTDTTANTLTIGTWHILKDPTILTRLRANLDPVMPDPDTLYPQSTLESLPYLRAIIKESLRLSYGTTARLMRIVPAGGATFCDQHIPAGTRISFSHTVYNNDPDVFKNPHEFRPERWLGDPEEVSRLEAHMISFSRGSRSCLGINLSYAELYTTFAHVFRRFDLSVVDTTAHDMDWKDCFVPRWNGHLKVRVEKRRE